MVEKKLLYTCLKADPSLVSQGFSTVVALESDRNPLAAFKLAADASAWCNEKNGIKPPLKTELTQTASVTKVPTLAKVPSVEKS